MILLLVVNAIPTHTRAARYFQSTLSMRQDIPHDVNGLALIGS